MVLKADNYLIGIDSGTSATKVLLFNLKGEIINSSCFSYPLDIQDADVVEQNPEDWWDALVKGVRYVSKDIEDKERIKASAFLLKEQLLFRWVRIENRFLQLSRG